MDYSPEGAAPEHVASQEISDADQAAYHNAVALGVRVAELYGQRNQDWRGEFDIESTLVRMNATPTAGEKFTFDQSNLADLFPAPQTHEDLAAGMRRSYNLISRLVAVTAHSEREVMRALADDTQNGLVVLGRYLDDPRHLAEMRDIIGHFDEVAEATRRVVGDELFLRDSGIVLKDVFQQGNESILQGVGYTTMQAPSGLQVDHATGANIAQQNLSRAASEGRAFLTGAVAASQIANMARALPTVATQVAK